MKIYNEAGMLMDESQADLSKGHLMETFRIRDDATPIDNITKHAWDDADYEAVQVYTVNEEPDNTPTWQDDMEAQVAYTAMKTNTLLEV